MDVRHCNDGVLLYQKSTGSTHLLSFAAWDMFESISRTGGMEVDEESSTLVALRSAGLIK
jgi:hypothetical protein